MGEAMADAVQESKGVDLVRAVEDPFLATPRDRQVAARDLAEERGIPVEAVRHADAEARLEREPYKLSRRQAEAIDLLLKGLSMTAIAKQVGVSRRTLHRWRYNHPQFIAVYARVTQELNEQTGRRAEQLVYQALSIVGEAMRPEKKESLRLSAALRVLSAMRVSKLLFTSPGESHFNLALDGIIRKQRLEENIDPNLPIDKYDREDALHLLEQQNVTENDKEIEGEVVRSERIEGEARRLGDEERTGLGIGDSGLEIQDGREGDGVDCPAVGECSAAGEEGEEGATRDGRARGNQEEVEVLVGEPECGDSPAEDREAQRDGGTVVGVREAVAGEVAEGADGAEPPAGADGPALRCIP